MAYGQSFRALWPAFCAVNQELAELERQMISLRTQMEHISDRRAQILGQLEVLKPHLTWCSVLPRDVRLSVAGQLGPIARARTAMACKEFCDSVRLALSLGMYKSGMPISAATGGDYTRGSGHTVVCTSEGELYTFG